MNQSIDCKMIFVFNFANQLIISTIDVCVHVQLFHQIRFKLYLTICFKHKFDRLNTTPNMSKHDTKHVWRVEHKFDRLNTTPNMFDG
jgi:hypothetical protein